MKKLVLFFFSCCIALCGCNSKKKDHAEQKTEVIQENKIVSGQIQATFSNGCNYAYYLPSTSTPHTALIFLDPHGDGKFPLSNYTKLADEFNIVLVGSNDSKNGMNLEAVTPIVRNLVAEVINQFHVQHVSLCGFSGGAKVALVSSSQDSRINSVICAGAALPAGSMLTLPPVLGFAGLKDMNYSDVASFFQSIPPSIPNALVEWKGKHEWPDSLTFRHAFYWTKLHAENDSLTSIHFQSEMTALINTTADAVTKANLLNELVMLTKDQSLHEKKSAELLALRSSSAYRTQIQKRSAELAMEENAKSALGESFGTKDLNWWNKKIADLRNSHSAMNDRLLGYISLASYSLAGRALASQDLNAAETILSIYESADPTNSEHAVMRAKVYMMRNQPQLAKASLKKALDLGADRSRLTNEFPPELLN